MITRVGLLTLPLSTNYGGILQAAALREVLTQLGADVVLLNRTKKRSWRFHLVRILAAAMPSAIAHVGVGGTARMARVRRSINRARATRRNFEFIGQVLPGRSGALLSSGDLSRAVTDFKLGAVVVGSDQVWRPDYVPSDAVADYFLGFAGQARRISYAASFGHAQWMFPHHTKTASDLLRDFHSVSVREASGVEICRDAFGRGDAVHVLDPTMLVDGSFYNRIAAPAIADQSKVLLEYILDLQAGPTSLGHQLAEALRGGHSVTQLGIDGSNDAATVGEWLRCFRSADLIVTDSFHGVVFSIIFQKQFVAVINLARGGERFVSLLTALGLTRRLIDHGSLERAAEIAAERIDFGPITARLSAMREVSLTFLSRALA